VLPCVAALLLLGCLLLWRALTVGLGERHLSTTRAAARGVQHLGIGPGSHPRQEQGAPVCHVQQQQQQQE
jgi:hypothetical protein